MTHVSQPRFHGIIPPLLTPLSGRDRLDVAGLERLVEHILSGGVQGLFVLGTTGEGPSLSRRLRHELIQRTCRLVNKRVPVLVNITDTSLVESLETAKVAVENGAEAVVLSPPHYIPITQDELLEYLRRVAGESPLPVLLYNMPSHVKVPIGIATVRALLDEPNIVGLKDSSGLMADFHALLPMLRRQRPDWSLLVGPEVFLAEAVLLGGHGAVCGGANLQPRLFVELYDAARERDVARILALHEQVVRTQDRIYSLGTGSSGFIQALKLALSCLGICQNVLAEPLTALPDEMRPLMQARLAECGVIPRLADPGAS